MPRLNFFSEIQKKLRGNDRPEIEPIYQEETKSRELLISTNPPAEIIVDDMKRPVWPVSTPYEFESLAELAKVFNVELREVTAHPGPITPEGVETVTAWGEGTEEAARLYAHLTGRQYCPLDRLTSLEQMNPQPSVLLLSLDHLNNELLTNLYAEPRSRKPIGIICAETASLKRQVLVRAAAASFFGDPTVRNVSVFPLWDAGKVFINERELSDLSREQILEIVGSRAGTLVIQTHSDGMDAMLGPNLTLCPLDQLSSTADKSRGNRCVETNWCHRSRTSISEFLSSSSFVSPNSFSAHILVWDVCWGAIPPDGLIDPAWGIGKRFLDSPRVGAILAPWDLSLSSPKLVGALIQNLESGMAIGDSLLAHNLSMEAQRFRHRMCLFGDPRVRLSSISDESRPATPRMKFETGFVRVVKPAVNDSTIFLRRLVASMIARPSYAGAKLSGVGNKAMRAIEDFEHVAGASLESERTVSAGRVLRSTVLACMRKRGPVIFNEWFSQAVPVATKLGSSCFACQIQSNKLVTSIFSIPGSRIKRRVSRCQRCGIVEDVPIDSNLTLSISSDRCIQLSGDLPAEAWKAQFLIRQQHTSRRLVFDWPKESNKSPATFIKLPFSLPAGILQAGIVLMHHTDIYSLCQFIRGDGVTSDLQSSNFITTDQNGGTC